MNKRNICANLSYDIVQKILSFQEERGIRHFADAVQGYIIHLEEKAYPAVARMGEMVNLQHP